MQTVCRKCLEKKPPQRFGTAAEVADRLQRILKGEPIPERPPGWAQRVGRLLRRHLLLVALVLLALGAAGGIWGFTAVTAYLSDPERVREGVEKRLRNGEPVTLIGETGPPGYFQWGAGEEITAISTKADRPFSVTTTKLALVEFPYAAQLKRFRLRAEVRHEMGFGGGTVGIFCGHKTHGWAEDKERMSFLSLSYAERGKVVQKKAKAKLEGRVQLQAYYVELGPEVFIMPAALIKPYKPFEPVGPGKFGPWRELSLEVTVAETRASWSPTSGAPTEPITTVTPPQLRPHVDGQKVQQPRLRELVLEYVPQGGIGLFVHQGGASFRHVVLEPLETRP